MQIRITEIHQVQSMKEIMLGRKEKIKNRITNYSPSDAEL